MSIFSMQWNTRDGWGLITGQLAAPFAVDHTQCQIPHTSDGIHNGQTPH